MSKPRQIRMGLLILGIMILSLNRVNSQLVPKPSTETENISLPQPEHSSKISVEEALLKRRSVRSYEDQALSLKELSQLLWAAQGKTHKVYGRTAPSAGALYPMEIYVVVGKVKGLKPGIYHYSLSDHTLTLKKEGDWREGLANSALGQASISNAPVDLVIAAEYARTTEKYGDRGIRYVHIEVGHVAQNIYLQAESLNLGTVIIGAFFNEKLQKLLDIDEVPLAIMPVGRP